MRIGIITLSASYNCGSLLQSYALKEMLSKYGDAEIINFSSEASHKQYDVIPKTMIGKWWMNHGRRGLVSELKSEKEYYTTFQNEYLQLDGKELFAKDLHRVSTKYDVIVAGSDQVWNVRMGDFDEAFFCDWTDAKKIAYAPSLGGHDVRESSDSARIIDAIRKFAALSVRETVGKECLDDILNEDVTKVLDPTLMYGEEKWKALAGERKINGDYIFYYSWAYCDDLLREIVSNYAKEKQMPVYVIDAHKWISHSYENDGFILCEEGGPLAFLNLMLYAKECFVESFHGMLFAYMFRRNFWLLDTHREYAQVDARLKELVELVGAKDRITTQWNTGKMYSDVGFPYGENPKLEEMRKVSSDYLDEAFGY